LVVAALTDGRVGGRMTATYWSTFAQVFRDHARLAKNPDRGVAALGAAVCRDLKDRATVVAISSDQVDAIPRLAPRYVEEAVSLAYQRPPFPVTFLAVGGTWDSLDQDWVETPLYAALIKETSNQVVVVPFHLGSSSAPAVSRNIFTVGRGMVVEGVGVRWEPSPLGEQVLRRARAEGVYEREQANLAERVAGGVTKALRALFLLESVNVALREGKPAGPGHRGNGVPSYEVFIRQPTRSEHDPSAQTVDWSHRWEVRGHFKHFRKGPIYEKNADNRVEVGGDSYVRVWCPPHVKGPPGKPLVPKVHIKVAS
jgi:hypothetical protein